VGATGRRCRRRVFGIAGAAFPKEENENGFFFSGEKKSEKVGWAK
jgi:hypothetical protein